ncbi:MAG TPA: hypothetical protein ENK90_01155 [Epsilonproteobacteria bacterium]|nr:hypothetical protein [Campylobacterota bacterium]
MEIILLLVLLWTVILICIILYKLSRWILGTKIRRITAFSFFFALLVGLGIYQLFFVKLEFIQSKVYPDLFLVKNVPKEKYVLNQAIKDFVITRMKTQPTDSNLSLRFYQYYKSYNPLVFGDSGTAYFIDNEEDLGGMVVEELSMYRDLELAVLKQTVCKESSYYCAKLDFFEEGYRVKTEIIDSSFATITHENN